MQVSGLFLSPADLHLASIGYELGGPQKWSGCCGEERNFISMLKIEPRFLGCPTCSLVTIPTELSWRIQVKPYKTDQVFTSATRRIYIHLHVCTAADLPYYLQVPYNSQFLLARACRSWVRRNTALCSLLCHGHVLYSVRHLLEGPECWLDPLGPSADKARAQHVSEQAYSQDSWSVRTWENPVIKRPLRNVMPSNTICFRGSRSCNISVTQICKTVLVNMRE